MVSLPVAAAGIAFFLIGWWFPGIVMFMLAWAVWAAE